MIAVLQYRHTSNPLNLPGEYPAETRPVLDGEKVSAPWILMEESDLKAISEALYPTVKAAFDAELQAKQQDVDTKIISLESTFEQLASIKAKIDGAGGKLESADQVAILTYALETLLQLRDPLLQMQRRFVGAVG